MIIVIKTLRTPPNPYACKVFYWCGVDLWGGDKLRDTVRKTSFLIHGFGDGDEDFFSIVKVCADFIAEFTFGDFDVVFGGSFVGHQVEETIINVNLKSV
jgi:hypothetical protein